jgi:putative sigma-54 modulation protein
MEFKISGRHMEITPAIREYAEQKTSRLPRFFNRIQSIQVVIDKHDPNHFEVEIVADIEHAKDIVTKRTSEDLYAAIDKAVDKTERQLTDHKEKLRNRKHIA